MSRYEVEFVRRAVADFNEAVDWYSKRSIDAADKWITAVEKALDALEQNPQQFPRAREESELGIALHEHAFGAGRRLTHRLIFAIRPNKVVVYAVHHASRRDLTIDDLLL
jgi:plasmid stabilization system protein ParE